jgi:hypothetical protein
MQCCLGDRSTPSAVCAECSTPLIRIIACVLDRYCWSPGDIWLGVQHTPHESPQSAGININIIIVVIKKGKAIPVTGREGR